MVSAALVAILPLLDQKRRSAITTSCCEVAYGGNLTAVDCWGRLFALILVSQIIAQTSSARTITSNDT